MRVRAVTPADRVDHDGEAVVLVDAQVVRLSALSTRLVDAAATWCDPAEVTAQLVEAFGPPPDGTSPEAATAAVLAQLIALGVLEVDETAP